MNDEKMHWVWELDVNKNGGVFAATAIEREFIKFLKKNLRSSLLQMYFNGTILIKAKINLKLRY